MRSSLVPHAVLLTHPRTMKFPLVVSQHRQKAVYKSRPGNLLSSAWCFWILHECAYHVQAKDGFQLLCLNGRFSKIRSHIYTQQHYTYLCSSIILNYVYRGTKLFVQRGCNYLHSNIKTFLVATAVLSLCSSKYTYYAADFEGRSSSLIYFIYLVALSV